MQAPNYEPTPRVLGLPANTGRWLLIPLGMLVLLCLGTVYSWSIFRKPLEGELNINATQSLLPFTVSLVFFSLSMPIAGFYIPRLGPRLVTAIGGVVVGSGYILSSFATNIDTLVITYGVIAGIGVGIAYGVPIAVSARWFPDRKGLAVGMTIIGFGLSPLITAPLANQLIAAYSVKPTLRIFGIVFALIILAVAAVLKFPPAEERVNDAAPTVSLAYASELFKSRSFYALWICYALGTLIGLSAIGISSPAGQEIIKIDKNFAASCVAIFAVCNGVSRPLFGWLTDRFKPRHVAIATYTLIIIACLLMANAREGEVFTYVLSFGLFWFCLGGWLAIAPTITLRFFNPERYAQNYGIVFTAYGAGALCGTLATGRIRDWFGSYTHAFTLMMGLAIVGILIATFLLKRDRV